MAEGRALRRIIFSFPLVLRPFTARPRVLSTEILSHSPESTGQPLRDATPIGEMIITSP